MSPLWLAPARRDAAITAAVTTLLALFWWLAVSASFEKSHTSDELPHITAGYAYDRFGDFRLHPENGNLPQRVFGLPALMADARFPMDETLWQRSSYWQLGWDLFYGLNNPTDWIVLCARALNALFGVALGLLIFVVASRVHGRAGGLLALSFYTLAPSFLAHAALATSDMAATFFLTLAPWLFWRHLAKRDLASGLLAGVAGGMTLVAKFNGPLLAPIYLTLVIADVWLLRSKTAARGPRLVANLALAVGQAGIAVGVVWAFFNFRFSARGPNMPELTSFPWPWEEMLAGVGWKRPLIQFARDWHLLPDAWLWGLTDVLYGARARPAFLAGEHSLTGWWQFFPTLFFAKTTLPMLGALLIAVVGGGRAFSASRRVSQPWLDAYLPLTITALLVWLTAITSHLNLGDRHILAVYPVLFVGLGFLATRRGLAMAGGLLLCGHVYASFSIRPHYLAAYNRAAGGPERAYRLAVDSALDWGQDLPALRIWLGGHRGKGEKVYLGYFGSAWPPHYGVRPDFFLPAQSYLARPPLTPYDLEPGLYCISATLLSEVYSPYRGPWTPDYELPYRELAASRLPESFIVFDYLRFARLCKFLQHRTPEANAGYSILIFRLTQEELRVALEGPVVATHRLRLP